MATTIVNLVPEVARIFGAKGGSTGVATIARIVKDYDFSKVNVNDKNSDKFLHTSLAPSFGTLNKESIKTMDDHLKIMIAGTNRALEKTPPADRSWDKIIETFMQNVLIEPMEGPESNIARADKLIKTDTNWFKFERRTDLAVVREVISWFSALVGDQDILDSTGIDIDVFADIVGTTGATIESFEEVWRKNEHREKTVVDIGVLRYPDPDHPYFKVYRIKLTAWSDTRRIIIAGEDANGITGQINVRRFKPRASVIDGLRADVHKKAVDEGNNMFA